MDPLDFGKPRNLWLIQNTKEHRGKATQRTQVMVLFVTLCKPRDLVVEEKPKKHKEEEHKAPK